MKTNTLENIDNNNDQTANIHNGLHVIIGLGQSGLATAQYLVAQGYSVAVTDGNPQPTLADKLPTEITDTRFGTIDADLLLQASRIIISPGIALHAPVIQQALDANISIVSDIQLFHEALAQREQQVPIVAITGSNAKSTVTSLVGQMAQDAGINVGIGGNIGTPALTLLENDAMQLAVLELSSFQLETVHDLNAHVATILNISPDHLDRHGDMETYTAEKHKIFQGAQSIVINRDDQHTQPIGDYTTVSFGSDQPTGDNYGLVMAGTQINLCKGSTVLLQSAELKVKGKHNLLNVLSALALGELAGLPLDTMVETCRHFAGLDHRCQFVETINGVEYFNDSKGTNIGSTMAAIKGLGESYATYGKAHANIVLIVGGVGKGQDFSEMLPLINQFVSHMYYIGQDAHIIQEQLISAGLSTSIHNQSLETLDNVVADIANLDTTNIKAVLLSPACASLDQFANYTVRGDRFMALVRELML